MRIKRRMIKQGLDHHTQDDTQYMKRKIIADIATI